MKKRFFIFAGPVMLLLIVAALYGGCQKGYPGIEVGNPETPAPITPVVGKFVVVTPVTGNENYLIEIASASEAKVSRFGKGLNNQDILANIVEGVTLSYEVQNDIFMILQMAFANGQRLLIRMMMQGGEVQSLIMMINGILVDSSFEIRKAVDQSGITPRSCRSTIPNVLNWLVDSLCTRLNACHASFTCDSCRNSILNLKGQIHDKLGLAHESPYAEMSVQEIANAITGQGLSTNRTHVTRCLSDVDALTCNSLSAEGKQVTSSDYSPVQNILPSDSHSCRGFFTFHREDSEGTCRQTDVTNPLLWFVDTLCTRIHRCHGDLTCDSCRHAILAMKGRLHDEMGLPNTLPYSQLTVQEIVDRIEMGLVSVNPTALSTCLTGLQQTTCRSLGDNGLTATPVNYDNLEAILPQGVNTCQSVLTSAPFPE